MVGDAREEALHLDADEVGAPAPWTPGTEKWPRKASDWPQHQPGTSETDAEADSRHVRRQTDPDDLQIRSVWERRTLKEEADKLRQQALAGKLYASMEDLKIEREKMEDERKEVEAARKKREEQVEAERRALERAARAAHEAHTDVLVQKAVHALRREAGMRCIRRWSNLTQGRRTWQKHERVVFAAFRRMVQVRMFNVWQSSWLQALADERWAVHETKLAVADTRAAEMGQMHKQLEAEREALAAEREELRRALARSDEARVKAQDAERARATAWKREVETLRTRILREREQQDAAQAAASEELKKRERATLAVEASLHERWARQLHRSAARRMMKADKASSWHAWCELGALASTSRKMLRVRLCRLQQALGRNTLAAGMPGTPATPGTPSSPGTPGTPSGRRVGGWELLDILARPMSSGEAPLGASPARSEAPQCAWMSIDALGRLVDLTAGWLVFRTLVGGGMTLKRLLRQMMTGARQRRLASGLQRWRADREDRLALEDLGDVRHRARRAYNRRGLARAWASWSELGHTVTVTKLACGHLRNRELGRAFVTWACYARDHAEAMRKLRRSVAVATHQQQSRAWISWRILVSHRLHALGVLSRAVAYLRDRHRARAWQSWLASAMGGCQLTRALRHGLRRELSRAWNTWSVRAATRTRRMKLAHRAIGRMLRQREARGWTTWHVYARGRARALRLLRGGIVRMVHRRLAMALSSWRQHRADCRRASVALAHMIHSSEGRAWRTWLMHARARARVLVVLRRGLSRLLNRQLARGWQTWAQTAAHRTLRARVYRRVLGRLTRRHLARALAAWAQRPHAPLAALPPTPPPPDGVRDERDRLARELEALRKQHAEPQSPPSSPAEEALRARVVELETESDHLASELEATRRAVTALEERARAVELQTSPPREELDGRDKVDLRRLPTLQLSDGSVSPTAPTSPLGSDGADMWRRLLAEHRDSFEERLNGMQSEAAAHVARASDENRRLHLEIERLRAALNQPKQQQLEAEASTPPPPTPRCIDASTSTPSVHDACTSTDEPPPPQPPPPLQKTSESAPTVYYGGGANLGMRTTRRTSPSRTTAIEYGGPPHVEYRIAVRKGLVERPPSYSELPMGAATYTAWTALPPGANGPPVAPHTAPRRLARAAPHHQPPSTSPRVSSMARSPSWGPGMSQAERAPPHTADGRMARSPHAHPVSRFVSEEHPAFALSNSRRNSHSGISAPVPGSVGESPF